MKHVLFVCMLAYGFCTQGMQPDNRQQPRGSRIPPLKVLALQCICKHGMELSGVTRQVAEGIIRTSKFPLVEEERYLISLRFCRAQEKPSEDVAAKIKAFDTWLAAKHNQKT